MARIDSTTAAVTLRITNEDEGKSEVVTCLFRWRLVIITILSLSPNSDLFELLPRRVETLFSALFQSSKNHVSFINFSITVSLSSLVETFWWGDIDLRVILEFFYFSFFAIFLAEIAVYRIPAPRGQTVSCYFDYEVSVLFKEIFMERFYDTVAYSLLLLLLLFVALREQFYFCESSE